MNNFFFPNLRMHLEYLKQANKALDKNSGLLWKKHSDTFSSWLKEQVVLLIQLSINSLSFLMIRV